MEKHVARFRVDKGLWSDFTDAVEASPDPETDPSKVLRSLVRWYLHRAPAPERPDPASYTHPGEAPRPSGG